MPSETNTLAVARRPVQPSVSRKIGRLLRSREVKGWLLCLPALIIFCIFFIGPAIVGLRVSFTDWNGVSDTINYVGFKNYIDLLKADRFWKSLGINWLVVAGTLVTQMPVGLLLAIGLSRKGRLMKLYRSAIFSPQVLSIAAVALAWTLIYDPYQGLLNTLIHLTGLEDVRIAWLGRTDTALAAMLVTVTWFYFGFHMVLYMAGLAAIPSEYYDAALIETDRWYHVLWYVTLPLLREVVLISFVLIFSGAFGHLIGLFSLMTAGGPAGRTELLGMYMNSTAFFGSQFGYGSAISMVMLFIVLAVVVWPAIRIARDKLEY